VKTLVREVQAHAHRPFLMHVDFQQVHAGEKVHVEIPVRPQGTAVGTRTGGIFMQAVTDLPVRCLPDNIPESIDIDVSGLEIGDAIHLRDIPLPEGVEPEIDLDQTICSVTPPTVAPADGDGWRGGRGRDGRRAGSHRPRGTPKRSSHTVPALAGRAPRRITLAASAGRTP
jgi:large subunit ribosomal protein L25